MNQPHIVSVTGLGLGCCWWCPQVSASSTTTSTQVLTVFQDRYRLPKQFAEPSPISTCCSPFRLTGAQLVSPQCWRESSGLQKDQSGSTIWHSGKSKSLTSKCDCRCYFTLLSAQNLSNTIKNSKKWHLKKPSNTQTALMRWFLRCIDLPVDLQSIIGRSHDGKIQSVCFASLG